MVIRTNSNYPEEGACTLVHTRMDSLYCTIFMYVRSNTTSLFNILVHDEV